MKPTIESPEPQEAKELTQAEKEHLTRLDQINKSFRKQMLFINVIMIIVKVMIAVVWIVLFYVLARAFYGCIKINLN